MYLYIFVETSVQVQVNGTIIILSKTSLGNGCCFTDRSVRLTKDIRQTDQSLV